MSRLCGWPLTSLRNGDGPGGPEPGPSSSPYTCQVLRVGPPKLLGQTHKGLNRRHGGRAKEKFTCIPIATRFGGRTLIVQ
jgi:hypothetical protein